MSRLRIIVFSGLIVFGLIVAGSWLVRQAWSQREQVLALQIETIPAETPEPASPTPTATPTAQPTQPSTPTATAQPTASPMATLSATPLFSLHLPNMLNLLPTATPTLTPMPTPTPTLPWPPPLAEPARSKVGIHVQWNNSPEIMEFIRRMKPAVVKAAGDLGFLAEVKEDSPSTVTVARLMEAQMSAEGDPVEAARAFVAKNLEQYRFHPAVDYWEGYNEPVVRDRMPWFAAFEAERVRVMASHGLRTAIGGFSTGVPEWEEMEGFLPAIEAAYEHGGILTLHEYDAPTMDRTVGMGLPGQHGDPARGPLALRYRWWYEDFLKPRGLVVPLVISEAGIDGGVTDRPGPDGHGWLDFRAYWIEQGLGNDPTRIYIDQLAWYDAELQRDDYVIGCAVFTAGPMNEDWRSFDITSILRHIATYLIVPAQSPAG
jgi:hypothetical protein